MHCLITGSRSIVLAALTAVALGVGDAGANPLNCSDPQTEAEAAICADASLLELEAQRTALLGGKPDAATAEAWGLELDRCGTDRECLATAYLNELQRLQLAGADPFQTTTALETIAREPVEPVGEAPEIEAREASPRSVVPYSEEQERINEQAANACRHLSRGPTEPWVECINSAGYRIMQAEPISPLMGALIGVGLVAIIALLLSSRTVRRILMFFVGLAFARGVYRYMNEPPRR